MTAFPQPPRTRATSKRRRKRPRKTVIGLSAAEQKKLLQRWKKWVLRIKSEVGDLVQRREIFVGLRSVLQMKPDLGRPGALLRWMMQNYIEAATIGVRRLCDQRDDVESLSRLLRQLLQYPGVLNLTAHERLHPSDARQYARQTFELCAGKGRSELSSRALRQDLRRIEDSAHRIQRFVNKKVAHAAPGRQLRRAPTFAQLSAAIKLLDEVTVRYAALLTGTEWASCAPVRQYDWRIVLLHPWLTAAELRDLGTTG